MLQSSVLLDKYLFTEKVGERNYGPKSDWNGELPPIGSAIFIGRLPYHIKEDELFDLFSKFGNIHQLTLKIDKRDRNRNRGIAFITYSKSSDAATAVEIMNNFQIRHGRHIKVFKEKDKRRLFLKGFPVNKTVDEIENKIRLYTDGLIKISPVEFFPGRVFADYDTPSAGKEALQWLINHKMFGRKIHGKYADPNIDIAEEMDELSDGGTSEALTNPSEMIEDSYLASVEPMTNNPEMIDTPPPPSPSYFNEDSDTLCRDVIVESLKILFDEDAVLQ